MSPPTTTATRPSSAYLDHVEARAALPVACPSDRAAAALDYLLRRRGHGSAEELRLPLDLSRQTIRNYRTGAVEVPPEQVWRIAAVYAAVTLPRSAADLEALLSDPGEDLFALFDLFYVDNERAAYEWIYGNRHANFRWNTDYPAA
jgi:hypothetical protein